MCIPRQRTFERGPLPLPLSAFCSLEILTIIITNIVIMRLTNVVEQPRNVQNMPKEYICIPDIAMEC